MIEDVIVVGAGPGGLASALQLRRHGLKPRIFECARPGGLLWNANLVENYPGFPDGLAGAALVRAFLAQATSEGVKITSEEVLGLTWEEALFRAKTATGTYRARAVVIASGTRPRPMTGFQIPEALRAQVVFEVADLLNLSGNQVIIVGAGEAAFDYAINLGRLNSVIILNRGEKVKCLPLLWERALACPNIDYRTGTAVHRLERRPEGGMIVECFSPHGALVLQADYLVGAVGREPHLDFVSASMLGQSSELENRGILHFVGDVKNGIFRQTAIAVGDGIRAGMCIAHALKELTDESDCLKRKGRHRPGLHR